jgi:SAM-dependent methyltransferase
MATADGAMRGVTGEAMRDEFDTLAAWTVEALRSLGPEHALPGSCRGSGRPSGLDWLLDRLDVPPGGALLDVGAGLGGPAAYAREHADVRPVCVDPVRSACRGAATLLGLPALVADACRLPLAPASFEAAWSLGTLCTTERKYAWLAELSRVVRPRGRLGLLVLVSTGDAFGTRWGNAFPADADLEPLLGRADFRLLDRVWSDDLPEPGAAWRRTEQAVERVVHEAHRADPRLARVAAQDARMAGLIGSGRVRGRLVVARASSV